MGRILRELTSPLRDREYCGDKNRYDKKGAETVKNDRWRKDRVRLRVYHCEECNGWHVTKSNA